MLSDESFLKMEDVPVVSPTLGIHAVSHNIEKKTC